jgi:phage terminase large subunit GpA-like protein
LDFEVWYECGICGGRIDEYEKPRMLATGRWVHAHPDVPVKGYRLSSLYAPVGWIEEGGATGWKALAREWFRATSRAGQGDVEILKTFVMTRLGETWADTPGEGVDPMGIASRAEHADTAWKDAVPEGVHVVTAGVDVQDDRLEVEIVGWGAHFESWSLDYIVIRGDPVDPGVWQELDCLLANSYPGTRKDPSIDPPSFQVRACCIDMGGHRTQQVYEYCRTRERRMIYAVKGSPNRAAPVWDRKVKRSTVYRATFRIVGTHAAKDAIYARLQVEKPGPGYCHFPEGRPDAYFQQLTAERKIKRHTAGRDIWVWECPPGHRNEALDCRVYAYAALLSWLAQGHLLPRAPTSSPAPSPASTTPEITPLTQPTYFRTSARHPSRTPWLQRKPRGWIRK